jgi:two-component system, OmpR family, response regulator
MSLTAIPAAVFAGPSPARIPAPQAAVSRLLLFVGAAVRPAADVTAWLHRAGAKCVCLNDLVQAFQASAHVSFDGAVVDAALLHPPRGAWLSRLRVQLECPLLVLAEHADEVDEIIALEQGADDYLVRPVSSRRLGARLMALTRHPFAPPPAADRTEGGSSHQAAGWSFDPARRLLTKGERSVQLTELLATLLSVLLEHEGKVVSREQLLYRVRSMGSQTKAQGIATYIFRLRQTLLDQGVDDMGIDCLSGRGYRLTALPSLSASAGHAK